jgi:hypothetical protein|tara:strand:+ start:251 stop:397 length:147 start_codon:yes stop_codon:yes gene_type:complete
MKIESEQVKVLETLAKDLDANLTYLTTLDHSGRTSRKIVIEYDIKQKK